LRYRRDYAAAGVPMLPVVAGEDETRRQILWYSIGLVAISLALVPVAHMGFLYLVAAMVLGARFVSGALKLRRRPTLAAAMALFRYSLVYLAVLFAAVAVDTVVRFGL
ncbi:MAG TPA: UbiA family prenyltransferase, partial [Actinomycetota bacterium]